MKLSNSESEFIKRNKEILSGIFRERIEDLKEEMVLENKLEEREKIRELILEFKRWLASIKIWTGDQENIKDTGI